MLAAYAIRYIDLFQRLTLTLQTVSWLPVEVAAAALLEMCDAPNQVLHLAHPNPVTWSTIVNPVSEVLRLALVSYSQWLSMLESDKGCGSVDKAVEIVGLKPALQLQEFFHSFPSSALGAGEHGASETSSPGEALGLKQLCLREAIKLSPSLRDCAPLGFVEAKKWLSSWKLV